MCRCTAFFLILLRLAIGWHFLYEGWHKYHSTVIGPTETNRPFTSEGYFRNAPGPLGPIVRAQLGKDPDDAALERLTVEPAPAGKDAPDERIPPVVGREIDDYTQRFLTSFNLDDAEKNEAETKAKKAAKAKVVVFLTTSVAGGQSQTEYRAKLAELRRLTARQSSLLSRDVDGARIMALKGEVAKARKESLDALDAEVAKDLRDELGGIIKKKLGADKLTAVPKLSTFWGMNDQDPFVILVPQTDGKSLPKLYDERYSAYYTAFKATYPLSDDEQKRADAKFDEAKELTIQWLPGKNAVPASVAVGQLALSDMNLLAAAPSVIAAREGLLSDAREESAQMTRYLAAALTDNQARSAPPPVKPEKSAFLTWMDRLTIWGLMVMGACLLFGVLTRLNCVLAAGFLAMTYAFSPPFPWLPAPPNNEGNYLYVNKNLVEMLALLALATTLSGRWFGLDALIHRLFSRDKPAPAPAVKKARAA
jgi:uncharacterized membrane protein YphA (DoxX/SURF4 family)